MSDVIVALDQGSSSARALAFDLRGREVGKLQRSLRAFHPRPGWVEHDPEELLRGALGVLEGLVSRLGRRRPAAIGLAAQRSTILFWDRRTGRSVGRALSWQDGRASALLPAWAQRRAEVYEKTGLVLTPYYSAPKIAWALRNWPAVRSLADKGRLAIGPVTTFLAWHLTKGEVFAADPTMAQRTLLFNLERLDWDPELLQCFGVPREALPAVGPSCGDWGRWKGIPLSASLGDQQAAAAALGAREPGAGVLNYGTGAFFLLNTGSDRPAAPGLLRSVALQRTDGPASYLLEGTVHAAGTSLDWLRENLGQLRSTSEVDRLCRSSARKGRRVFSLNAIGGLGAPRWDYESLSGFLGLTSRTRREDVVRSVAEGIAFLIADIVQAVRSAGIAPRVLRCSGGLSRIGYLVQFQSDLLGLPIERCVEKEATAWGAALLAAEAVGITGLGASRALPRDKVFKPRLNPRESQALLQGWARFVEGMQSLSRDLRKAGVL